jgi:hypothetical protein
MNLAEIKMAIMAMPAEELVELAAFIRDRNKAAWDRQMEEDAASGKLDFLSEEATRAESEGTLRDWPEFPTFDGGPVDGALNHD